MSSTRSPVRLRWIAACGSSRTAIRMLRLVLMDFVFLVAVNAALVGISAAGSTLEFEIMRGKRNYFFKFQVL
jgi:hypothetical protein